MREKQVKKHPHYKVQLFIVFRLLLISLHARCSRLFSHFMLECDFENLL